MNLRGCIVATTTVACISALSLGCGGSSSGGSGGAPLSSGAPVTSQANAATFRSLARGTDSGFITPNSSSLTRIAASEQDLVLLWGQHQTGKATQAPLPQVDFSSERVVALFLGPQPSTGYSIEVVGIDEPRAGVVELSYVLESPTGTPPPGSVVTSPYHIVAINRLQGDVTFKIVTAPPSSTAPPANGGNLVVNERSLQFAVGGPHLEEAITANGGAGTRTWSVVAGTLPAGLSFSSTNNGEALFAGSPTVSGTYFLNVKVQDGNFSTGTGSIPVTTAPLRVSPSAGNGTQGVAGDGGLATAAQLNQPSSTAVDALGNLFILDRFNHRVRKVDYLTGVIQTVAGNGTQGFSGDGGPALAAQLNTPYDLAFDPVGALLISDNNNHRVRKVNLVTGIITTVAGNGAAGFSGDGGPGLAAQLNSPNRIEVDAAGHLLIADASNHRIRRVDYNTGIITTVAGTGGPGFSGDGGAAVSAQISVPVAIGLDKAGNMFVLEIGNNASRIRRIDAVTGIITTYAGAGRGFSGDGGNALAARFNSVDFVVDQGGNLFVADSNNHRIRRIDASTGLVSTIIGNGQPVSSGDGGLAAQAQVSLPMGLALDAKGRLWFSEANPNSNRVRVLGP